MKKVVGSLATLVYLLIWGVRPARAAFFDIANQINLPKFTAAAFISFLVKLLIIAAFIIAFIFLLIGGIRWITSGGDPKALESAKGTVTSALVGLFLVVSAFALIRLIEFFFKIPIISQPLALPHI